MPEGPEVRNIARTLNIRLAGATLISLRKEETTRIDRKILEVACHGKLIIFVLEGELFLTSSLGMTGSWVFEKEGGYLFSLETSIGVVYYRDPRKFGKIRLLNYTEVREKLKTLGVDLLEAGLAGGIEEEEWLALIPKSKKKVCTFLLEQNCICGIGNYLRAEILYAAKISPFRLLNTLTREELLRLRDASLRIIVKAYISNGLTIKNYADPEGKKGMFICKVYGRKRDPSGREVKAERIGGRVIYYVE